MNVAGLGSFDPTGGPFLVLYLGATLCVVAAHRVLHAVLKGAGVPGPVRDLDAMAIAYLAGGAPRVADAFAVAILAAGGVLTETRPKRIATAGVAHALPTAFAPLAAIASAGGGRQAYTRQELIAAVKERLGPLRFRLAGRGFVVDDAAAGRLRWATLVLFGGLLAFGLTTVAIGLSRGKPVAFLVVLVVATAALGVFHFLRPPRRTRAGDAALADLGRCHARAARAPIAAELSLAVALAGTAVLAGTAHAGYRDLVRTTSAGNGTGGGCGSGGNGGGGCGGCGGGD
ncbi:TIGR04222 domain-containing membrane protein [Methylobacterium sp. Leaf466]|uniref:TIGR04222 domain-containing membrane protein n=1 Tax=Methylobacterium sp. Leaf466 TaxID=1736386 RepID=UPI0006F7DF36|nr:TIGR04222 domain-containing membrane protein [Methylobacterium sp. Leaf466]KQT88860.1 hypothetical protein ASG59_14865 [Methylobacterium sp. Leaf466]